MNINLKKQSCLLVVVFLLIGVTSVFCMEQPYDKIKGLSNSEKEEYVKGIERFKKYVEYLRRKKKKLKKNRYKDCTFRDSESRGIKRERQEGDDLGLKAEKKKTRISKEKNLDALFMFTSAFGIEKLYDEIQGLSDCEKEEYVKGIERFKKHVQYLRRNNKNPKKYYKE